MTNIKAIAYYLPQYHPIKENDIWWGKGFTEWTNVTKAAPLFKGHNQPRFPADLGYYDLRLPDVREAQAEMARAYGLHGFCYYHYWFGNGNQLLERPFKEVLQSGKPDFPFMLCWANEKWKGVWFGASKGKILIEQTYPGKTDFENHFNHLLPAFADDRYIKVDGKPVFHVYRPSDMSNDTLQLFTDTFRNCALQAGLKGLYLLAGNCNDNWIPTDHDFDGMVSNHFHKIYRTITSGVTDTPNSLASRIWERYHRLRKTYNFDERRKPFIIPYNEMSALVAKWPQRSDDYFPQVVPDWDNSARAGNKSLVLTGSTPALWKAHLEDALHYLKAQQRSEPFLFIKSWNEWAEGNYLEPDLKWGHQYLEVLQHALEKH